MALDLPTVAKVQGSAPDASRRVPSALAFFRANPHLRESFCGGVAAVINIVITFPPNKIMFRQQLFGLTTRDAYQNVKSEGLVMLFRGVNPPLLQASASKALMFGLYNWYNRLLTNRAGNIPGIHLVAAGLSGTTEAILAPFETPKFNREFVGTYDTMLRLNRFGLREHYRGLSAILLRNGPASMLFFGLREPVRRAFPDGESPTTRLFSDFVCGAMLGAILSTVTFPINVAKTRMQSVYNEPHISVRRALQLTYLERGSSVRRVYRGVGMNCCRSLLSWGIINSIYEKLKSITEV